MSYSRPCGVSLAACGANKCRCVPVDPGGENGPQEAAHDADVLRDPETLKVALSGAGKARTGDYDPLDQAHNEGARR